MEVSSERAAITFAELACALENVVRLKPFCKLLFASAERYVRLLLDA